MDFISPHSLKKNHCHIVKILATPEELFSKLSHLSLSTIKKQREMIKKYQIKKRQLIKIMGAEKSQRNKNQSIPMVKSLRLFNLNLAIFIIKAKTVIKPMTNNFNNFIFHRKIFSIEKIQSKIIPNIFQKNILAD